MFDKMNGTTSVEMNGDSAVENGNEDSKTNLIINYLPQGMNQEEIKALFSTIGTVTSCKLVRDKTNGSSLGYAFVNYTDASHAAQAVKSFNQMPLQDKRIKVSYARPSSNDIKNANLYISGLPKNMKEEDLVKMFEPFGAIITSKLLTDESGESRGVGFVRFDRRGQAEAAIQSLNNKVPPGYESVHSDPPKITVKFANPPSSKQQPLPFAFQSPMALTGRGTGRGAFSSVGPLHHQGANVRYSPLTANFLTNHTPSTPFNAPNTLNGWCIFVYGLPAEEDQHTMECLMYKLFSRFGAINDVRVKKGTNYGFVNMPDYEAAYNAILNLNGQCIPGQDPSKPLQVSFKTPSNKKQ